MNLKDLFKNQKGESLVAVVVALGLAGVLTVVIMNNMSMQTKAAKTAEIQTNLNDLKRLIQDFVSRSEPCSASFAGVSRGEDILALKQKTSYTGAPFAEVNKEFQKSGLMITNMQLLTLKDQIALNIGNTGEIDSNGVGTAYLRVKVRKIRASTDNSKYFGGADTAIIVPVIGEFAGEEIVADGLNENDVDSAWNVKFNNLKNSEDAKITAMGLAPASYPLLPQDGIKPSDASFDATHPNYVNSGGTWSVIWGVYHANFPISDCGSHLSN